MKKYLSKSPSKEQSKVLAAFCFDLLEALKDNPLGKSRGVFPCNKVGLCSNMDMWRNKNNHGEYFYLGWIMNDCPFNNDDFFKYMLEMRAGQSFQNKKRMEFVKHWAAKHVDK